MKKIFQLLLFITCLNLFAQKDLDINVGLLGNQKIVDINLNQEVFIKSVGKVLELVKKEYQQISDTQKVVIIIDFQTKGKPKYEFHTNPKMEITIENNLIDKINALNIENPKLINFPILFLINSKFEELSSDFDKLVLPNDKIANEYLNATLKQKFELNKKYASEILPILTAYQTIVDDQFVGVKNFGNQINTLNHYTTQDPTNLTSYNSNYWRATMEMSSGNQLIPITKIFLLISQGEIDYALKYIEILSAFSDPKTICNDYLDELYDRLQIFKKELGERINKGIIEHDKENYTKAITIYNSILDDYPNSAWAKYELYYSNNALKLKN